MKTYLKKISLEETIRRLKNGEVVKIENSKDYIKMVEGVICKFYNDSEDIGIGAVFYKNPSDVYFETKDPFKIKETGLYKSERGKRIFISKIYKKENIAAGVFENSTGTRTWKLDGEEITSGIKENIISKWED